MSSLMFQPPSYMAFVIKPQPPILSELNANLERSEGIFSGQHVALDLSAVNLSPTAIGQLVTNLDDIEDSLRCRPAQPWLEGVTLQISAMN